MRVLWVSFVALALLASAPALAADGRALVKANCASCHGPGGKGDSDEAVRLKAPQITGASAATIVATVRGDAAHEAASEALSDQELQVLASYLAGD